MSRANTIHIRGGRLIDPVADTIEPADVFVDGGRVREKLDRPADQVIDAAGCYVAPGFIDLHTHVFSHDLFPNSRLPADRIGVRQGVACVVDAGSSGAVTIDAFPETVLARQSTRVYAFVNIGSPGLPGLAGGHTSRPELCDLPGVVHALERYPDWLVGVKVLASASHTGAFGLEAVRLAVKAAALTNKPLMLHIGNAPPVVDDVLAMLRPGDIVTHAYHGKLGGVLGYGGRVIPAFRDAVERGVLVDVGHGRASFSFRVCETALEQGMPVHCISSDLHRGNVDRYAISLARTMSKLRALGLDLMEVVRAVTETPARATGICRDGLGSIAQGQSAYVTVFRETDSRDELEDAEGVVRRIDRRIETVGVVVGDRYNERTEPL